ncbi:MAG TPA: MBL fold metallo-hydrolase [Chthoniobacterales bacterium]|nr:MBL fold metallo-hydrolase [Chthoniobacterales bacterium]
MKIRILFCLLVSVIPAVAGLEKYSTLIKSDPPAASPAPPRDGVRVTYLGTNAYLFESRDATLLIDPYFSRQSLFRTALKLEPVRETNLINQWIHDHPKIDAVLVTHGHVDHLFDVPPIARGTGARVIASRTSIQLVESAGVPKSQTQTVRPGSTASVRGAVIHVLPASHDRVFGSTPFPGPVKNLPPRQIDDWVLAEPLAFMIEMGGKRIFINSGGRADRPVESKTARVDLAIVGVASPDAIAAFSGTIAQLKPRYILPSHQDNFFRPLQSGFGFLALTDFPAVRRAAATASGAEVILLDYFKPWTLR